MAETPMPEGLQEFLAETPPPSSAPNLMPSEGQEAQPAVPTDTAPKPAGLDEFVNEDLIQEKYGSPGQQLIAGIEGAAKGALGPIATGIERAIGVKPEAIEGRMQANPITHYGLEIAGLAGTGAMGTGLGGILGKAGEAAQAAAGLGKIGSAVVKNAVETALFQSGDEMSKLILQDPQQSVQTAIADVGLAGVLGGALGGGLSGIGSASQKLWDAGAASKTGGLLKAVANKMGGIEGVAGDSVDNMVQKAGIELAPDVKMHLSNDPYVQNAAKTLEQSDTTWAGRKHQEAFKAASSQIGNAMVETLGKAPQDVEKLADLSKYESGKSLGTTLSSEYAQKLEPLSKSFEQLKNKFNDLELTPDIVSANKESVVPGTISQAADKIGKLAVDQGWTASPSSDIVREVSRVMKELPLQKNIRDLNNYVSQLQHNTGDPLNGPLRRAGGLMSGILRDAADDTIAARLGQTQGEQAVAAFNQARKGYAQLSDLRQALNDRLHIRGANTSNFPSLLKEMAQTDGEALLNRLSGKTDADLLQFLQKNFPKTAEQLKQHHLDALLKAAADKARPGEIVNKEALIKGVNGLTPELKNFTLSRGVQDKFNALSQIVEKFNDLPHNFSNTARTWDKLSEYLPGSAIGMIAMLSGHGFATSAIAAALTKVLGKEAPDAIKLSMLKFLGSSNSIEASGFKAMVDSMHAMAKGENALVKATKNVFKADAEVLPSSAMPTEGDRNSIKRHLQLIESKPESLMNVGKKAAYYMPEHGGALVQTASTVAQYLKNQKPQDGSKAPLDPKTEPSNVDKAKYQNALNLAQQPLLLLEKVKNGTVTPQDIVAVKTMYPGLYTRMTQKLMTSVIEQSSKGKMIPYTTRMGLSLMIGQPLDSTMTPEAITSSQRALMPNTGNPMEAQNANSPKGRPSAPDLQKIPNMYRTPSQANEERSLKR